MKLKVFVSGVQKELAAERLAIKQLVKDDYLLRDHFEVFLFEDSPAKSRPASKVYIEAVRKSDIYLCVIGEQYGMTDKAGVSATEKEYIEAVKTDKECLIYIKKTDKRDSLMEKFISKIKDADYGHVYDRFDTVDELKGSVYEGMIDLLREKGIVGKSDFDERICTGANISEVDTTKLKWFLANAKATGRFPFGEKTPMKDVFIHLKLFKNKKLINAAILLFGKNPQKYFSQAVIKCLKVAGTEIEKPFDNYQIYGGNIFEQADRAAAFVIDSLRLPVVQKMGTVAVGRPFELPEYVINEAIINAIAHRDYNPTAGVQVHVLADRIEIFNPGRLPAQLSIEDLSKSHESYPGNPIIADVFYKANYIQQAGSGTKEMVKLCKAAGLPAPVFESKRGQFKTIISRDIFTEEYLKAFLLNERQLKAIIYLKQNTQITNVKYRSVCQASRQTATRDLAELVKKRLILKIGKTGAGIYYIINASKTPQTPQ